jgi:diadenosine tetraphosphate (Ap4A) HIT family hydrolase
MPNAKNACPFCDKERFAHQIAFENKHFYVLIARSFLTPGHVMIVPKRHRADLNAITKDSESALFRTLNKVIYKLQATFGAEGFNILTNIGRPAGQTIPHFHIHVIPRSRKEKNNPLKLIFNPGSRHGSKPSRLDVVRIVKRIKRAKV